MNTIEVLILLTRRKYIYVAHPFRNDPEGNLKEVGDICRELYKNNPDVIPISPIHLFSWMDPQEETMESCYDVMDFCKNNVTFFGDWLRSDGCMMEAEYYRRQRQERLGLRMMSVVILLTVVYCLWVVLG